MASAARGRSSPVSNYMAHNIHRYRCLTAASQSVVLVISAFAVYTLNTYTLSAPYREITGLCHSIHGYAAKRSGSGTSLTAVGCSERISQAVGGRQGVGSTTTLYYVCSTVVRIHRPKCLSPQGCPCPASFGEGKCGRAVRRTR